MWTGKEALVLGGLTAACQTMLGYFRTAPNVTLPVPEAAVTEDMRQKECWIAAYGMMSVVGFDPGSDPDTVVLDRYKLAMQWLRDVAKGAVQPFETAQETPDPADVDTTDAGAAVYTDSPRNWDARYG
jgi:phage gp36-like protein